MGDSTIQTASTPAPTKYVVGAYGIDYKVAGESRRAEPGDVVDDLPSGSVHWLVSGGSVEKFVEPVVETPIAESTSASLPSLPSLPSLTPDLSPPTLLPTPASTLLSPPIATA